MVPVKWSPCPYLDPWVFSTWTCIFQITRKYSSGILTILSYSMTRNSWNMKHLPIKSLIKSFPSVLLIRLKVIRLMHLLVPVISSYFLTWKARYIDLIIYLLITVIVKLAFLYFYFYHLSVLVLNILSRANFRNSAL